MAHPVRTHLNTLSSAPACCSFTALAISLVAVPISARAQSLPPSLPQGGNVVSGTARIANTGDATTIVQSTKAAVINWNSFSIGVGNSVTFNQPDAQSVTLNLVGGNAPSTLAGSLGATGSVVLLNPNGVAITSTGTVNVGSGFVASTLALEGTDATGKLQFSGNGHSAAVSNAGHIVVGASGFAALVGGSVANSGTINVPMGHITLAAGEAATIDTYGDGFLQVALRKGPLSQMPHATLLQMSGSQAYQAWRQVIAMPDSVAAASAHAEGHSIVLGPDVSAPTPIQPGHLVSVSGHLDTSSATGQGGTITLAGPSISLSSATLDASGATGGGSVSIGGGSHGAAIPGLTTADTVTIDAGTSIRADSTALGNAGNITVWSNKATRFAGTISAQALGTSGDGGNAEVSGASLGYAGTTNLLARHGKTGTLLLDPGTIIICHTGDAGCSDAVDLATVQGDSSTSSTGYLLDTTLADALGSASVSLSASVQIKDSSTSVAVSTGTGGALTLTAPNIALQGAYSVNGGLVIANTDGASTITGVISGAGDLTKSGAGTLTLSGANTFSGGTTLTGGTLQAGSTDALGATSGLDVSAGAVFDLNCYNDAAGGLSGAGTITDSASGTSVTFSAGGTFGSYAFSGTIEDGAGTVGFTHGYNYQILSGTNTYSGATTLNADNGILQISGSGSLGSGTYAGSLSIAGGARFVYSSSTDQILSGVISGDGSMTKDTGASSTLTLSGANTYTGGTTVNAGTLSAGSSTAFGTSGLGLDSGTTLDLNGQSVGIGLTGSGGGLTGGGTVTNSAIGTSVSLSLGGFGTQTFSGTMQDGAGTVSLIVYGNGATFTGTNTFTGGISVALYNAVFVISDSGSLGSGAFAGAISIANGATFKYSSSANQILSGAVSGAGALMKDTSTTSTLTLSGTNTYSGRTTVAAGTLQVLNTNTGSAVGQLGSGPVSLAAGATLEFTNSATSDNGYVVNNTIDGDGRLLFDGPDGSITTLGGDNAYTGGTQINSGTVNIDSYDTIFGTGAVTMTGGAVRATNAPRTLANDFVLSGSVGFGAATNITGSIMLAGDTTITPAGNFGSSAWSGAVNLGANTLSTSETGPNVDLGIGGGTWADGNSFTIAGAISGSGGVTHNAPGTLLLTGANTYTGATTVSAGTLVIGEAGSLNSGSYAGAIAVASGANFVYSSSVDQTLSGVISGAGNFTKDTGVTSTVTLTGANTYTGTTTVDAGTLVIGNGGTIGALGSGAVVDNAALAFNRCSNVYLSNTLSGSGSLTQAGSGTLWLPATTFSGAIYIDAGVLNLASGNSQNNYYPGAPAITVNNGGTLAFGGYTVWGQGSNLTLSTTSTITVNQGGAIDFGGTTQILGNLILNNATITTGTQNGYGDGWGSFSVLGTLTATGTSTINAGATGFNNLSNGAGNAPNLSIQTPDAADSLTINAPIASGVSLVKNGAGTLTLTGANIYTATTTVNAGTLKAGSTTALGSNSAVTLASGATLDLAGFDASIGSLAGDGGAVTDSSATAVTLTTGGDNTSTTFGGVIQNGSGVISLTKANWGTLTLTGANTYTGATNITGGTLSLAGSLDVGTGTATLAVADGAALTGSGVITGGTLAASGTGTVNLTGNNMVGTITTSGTVGAFAFNNNQSLALDSIDAGANAIAITTTPGSGANLVLNSGAVLASTASGTAIELAADGVFTNNADSGALSAANGRWLVYSATPDSDSFGSLDSGNTAIWNTTNGGSVAAAGTRYVFAYQPTLTFTSTSASKTYGDVASVDGHFIVSGLHDGVSGVYLADTTSSAYAGAPSVTSDGTAASATVAGGPYAITVSAGSLEALNGYGLAFVSTGMLTIDKAALAITYTADPFSRSYGAYNPVLAGTAVVSGLVNDDQQSAVIGGVARFTSTATNTSHVGQYAITGSGLKNLSTNYTMSIVQSVSNVTALTINPATLRVIYTATATTNTYGTAPSDPTGSYTATGYFNGDNAANVLSGTAVFTTAATASSNVGKYAVDGSGLISINSDYVLQSSQYWNNIRALTITPAALTITYTADPFSRTYGTYNPTLTGSAVVSGLVNGDQQSAVVGGVARFTSTSTNTAHVGQYAITGSGLKDLSTNYTLNVVQAVSNAMALTINPATLRITYTATAATSTYGTAPTGLSGSYSANGYFNGDNAATVLSGTAVFGTAATAGGNVGKYAIAGSGLVSINPDYVLQTSQYWTNASALQITPAALTITYTANPFSRTYGTYNPALSGTQVVTGLVNGDQQSAIVGGVARFTSTATNTAHVGRYAINGWGLKDLSTNYTLNIVQAVSNAAALTINPATLRITYTATPVTSSYGIAPTGLTGSYSANGFFNGDSAANTLSGTAVFTTAATATSSPGKYAVNGTGLVSINADYVLQTSQYWNNVRALTINLRGY